MGGVRQRTSRDAHLPHENLTFQKKYRKGRQKMELYPLFTPYLPSNRPYLQDPMLMLMLCSLCRVVDLVLGVSWAPKGLPKGGQKSPEIRFFGVFFFACTFSVMF